MVDGTTPFEGTIVDSGFSTNDTYIKWSNGIMICTKRYSFSLPASTAETGGYRATLTGIGNWIVPFIGVPFYVNVTNGSNSGVSVPFLCTFIPNQASTATIVGNISLFRNLQWGTGNLTLDIFAIGRWK